MKNIIVLILCFIVISLSLLFTACGECNHDFKNWETINAPTCVDMGTKIAHCSLCGLSKTEAIKPTGHTEILLESVTPSCSSTGLTAGVRCSLCDKILVEQEIIAKNEHSFVDGTCEYCRIKYFTEDLEFTLNKSESGYEVSLGNCQNDIIIIPSKYEGLPVEYIGATSFNNGNFSEIYIPSSILTIEEGAFKGCSNLQKITIPFVGKSADATGKEALLGYIFGKEFFESTYLAKQAYPSPYINASYVAEYYIPLSLREVVLTGNLTFGAFDRCASLTSVTIPKTVMEIPNYAFRECTSLTSFYISENVSKIRGYSFIGCTSLSEYTVDANNREYKSVDGHIFSKDGKIFVLYADGKRDVSFAINEGVTEIGNYAFYKNSKLEEISLPGTLEKIGYYSFDSSAALKIITIPSSVIYIDDYAFSHCKNLHKIFLPNELDYVGEGAFWKLRNDAIIYYAGNSENPKWDDQWNASKYTVVFNSSSIE